jgi:shikimate dehydrogenase
MMYAPQETVFMQWSAKNGATQVFDGLGMLVEQAAEAFYIWRSVKPETASVIKQVRDSL